MNKWIAVDDNQNIFEFGSLESAKEYCNEFQENDTDFYIFELKVKSTALKTLKFKEIK